MNRLIPLAALAFLTAASLAGANAQSQLPDKLEGDSLRHGLKTVSAETATCTSGKRGVHRFRITVTPAGTVSKIDITRGHNETGRCLARALFAATFPRAKNATTFVQGFNLATAQELSSEDVREGVRSVRAATNKCKKRGYGPHKFRITVAPAGTVKSIETKGTVTTASTCLSRALMGAKFKITHKGKTFNYGFHLGSGKMKSAKSAKSSRPNPHVIVSARILEIDRLQNEGKAQEAYEMCTGAYELAKRHKMKRKLERLDSLCHAYRVD